MALCVWCVRWLCVVLRCRLQSAEESVVRSSHELESVRAHSQRLETEHKSTLDQLKARTEDLSVVLGARHVEKTKYREHGMRCCCVLLLCAAAVCCCLICAAGRCVVRCRVAAQAIG
jgi:hypothetical protein